MNVIRTILWKHLIVIKRKWLITLGKSLVPSLPIVVLFIFIFGASYYKNNFNSTSIDEFNRTSIKNEFNRTSIKNDEILTIPQRIFYTPKYDPFYKDIMNKVKEKLQISDDDMLAFDSDKSLIKYYENNHNTNNSIVGVFFKGTDHKKLDYTMRYYDSKFHEFLETSQLYSNKPLKSNRATDYYTYGILNLQISIDELFIEQGLGRSFVEGQNVSLQLQKFLPLDKENNTDIYQENLPFFLLHSYLILCFLIAHVVEEKSLGTKELMQFLGVKPTIYWIGSFINTMIPITFGNLFVVLLLKVSLFGNTWIEYTDATILFCFLQLFCMAANLLYFAMSTVFTKAALAVMAAAYMWRVSYFLPIYSSGLIHLSWFYKMLYMFLPNMGLYYGCAAILSYEQRESNLLWSNLGKSASEGSDDVTMSGVFLMLGVDIVVYWCLLYYFDAVWPRKYGIRKSVFFPFQHIMKIFSRRDDVIADRDNIRLEEQSEFRKCLEIQGLSKQFGKKCVVENLDLILYEDEITVLMGRNGAGKSTLISLLTGMLQPTKGTIIIDGVNMSDNEHEIRKKIGFCPQQNQLFSDLSIKEHLMFYARLKGKTGEEAETEACCLLERLNLLEESNELMDAQSEETKRKLCLGIALIGGSKILILDDPTLGLEPDSREQIDNLLKEYKQGRTILISTHSLEEASILGDRIAIMRLGKLNIKTNDQKKTAVKYQVSFELEENSTVLKNAYKSKILAMVTTCQVTVKNLSFKVTCRNREDMTSLLKFLQVQQKLTIQNVLTTTIEDVLLEDLNDNGNENNVYNIDVLRYGTNNTGRIRIFLTLFQKRFRFFKKTLRHHFTFIVFGIIFVAITIKTDNIQNNGPEFKLGLDSYKNTSVYYNGTEETSELLKIYKQVVEQFGSVALKENNVQDAILKRGTDNILYYLQHMVAGAEFDFNNTLIKIIALYNNMAIHGAPISINLITNALAKWLLGDEYSISASNWPLHSIRSSIEYRSWSYYQLIIFWTFAVPTFALYMLAGFILYPQKEMSSKCTQLKYMCGVKPSYNWIANFVGDIIIYILILIPLSFIFLLSELFRGFNEWFTLLRIFLHYGMCGIPFAYLFSRNKTASGAFSKFMTIGIILGNFLAVMVWGYDNIDDFLNMTWFQSLIGDITKILIFLFFPHVNLIYTLFQFSEKVIGNFNMNKFPERFLSMCQFNNSNPCCSTNQLECDIYKDYLPIINKNLILMSISFVLYMGVCFMLDTYYIQNKLSRCKSKIGQIYHSCRNKCKRNNSTSRNNEEISENTRQSISNEERYFQNDDTLQGTTSHNDHKYFNNFEYCAQNDGLNKIFTGREVLETILILKGYPLNVEQFFKYLGLTEDPDTSCGQYSDGNKKKLSLAVFLIGFPNFVIPDELISGIDPVSRKNCINFIQNMQRGESDYDFLENMTEHDDIMTSKKDMISKGFSITLILQSNDGCEKATEPPSENKCDTVLVSSIGNSTYVPSPLKFKDVNDLKRYFFLTSTWKVESSHLLQFDVKESDTQWSTTFLKIGKIKELNPHLIQDYIISEI